MKDQKSGELPPLQSQILQLFASGMPRSQIATELHVPGSTVSILLPKALETIGASDQEGAAAYLAKKKVSKKRVVRQKAKGPIDPSVGRRIRDLRRASGMTQAQLAEPEFTKGFISLLETGRTRVSLRAAEILAQKMGVPMAELLPTGSRAATIFPKGMDGQLQEAVNLINQGAQFTLSAREALTAIFADYTRAKNGVKKILQMLDSAPVPNNQPDNLEAWMTHYRTWLQILRSSVTEKPSQKKVKV